MCIIKYFLMLIYGNENKQGVPSEQKGPFNSVNWKFRRSVFSRKQTWNFCQKIISAGICCQNDVILTSMRRDDVGHSHIDFATIIFSLFPILSCPS